MRKILTIGLIGLVLGLTGCATAPTPLQPVAGAPKTDFSNYNRIIVQVSKIEGVEMSEDDLNRMRDQIVNALKKRYEGRFQIMGSLNEGTLPTELTLKVRFTKFQKLKLGLLWGKPTEIKADIALKRGDAPLFAGAIRAYGQKVIYGGDIGANLIKGNLLNFFPSLTQPYTEQAFAEKLAKSLP